MQNKTGGSRRPKWLNWYRIFTTLALVALMVMGAVALNKLSSVSERSFAPITVEQTSKVETAAAFLQTVGFNDPVYLGITQAVEGKYPTFRATAIGGEPVDLWIRTTSNGGLELQLVNVFDFVKSADDLARLASDAVYDWENIPASIKPRTDGAWGEYESRKYTFEKLSKYDADYGVVSDETAGWPKK